MSALKTWKRIPLHHKILGALVLGAIFGALFNVSKYELDVTSREGGNEITTRISRWSSFQFLLMDGTQLASFGPEDQQKILQYARSVPRDQRSGLVVVVTTQSGDSAAAGPSTSSSGSGRSWASRPSS